MKAKRLTHVDEAGHARMVDISDKAVTRRSATARGRVRCSAEAVQKYFQARTTGPGGRAQNTEKELSFKNNLSQMLNLDATNIAFMGNSSDAIFTIALSLDW